MAYIVDLTVILHRLFLSIDTRRVSAEKVRSAVKDYAKGSSRSQIHKDIRNYVASAQTHLSSYHDKDLAMEKIIDLIEQHVPSQNISYRSEVLGLDDLDPL
jgi:Mg2+ and Co2+ transporter CorA